MWGNPARKICRNQAVLRQPVILQHIQRRRNRQELNHQYGITMGNIFKEKEEGVVRLVFPTINDFGLTKKT